MRAISIIALIAALAVLPRTAGAEGIYLGSGIGLGLPTPEVEPLGKELEHEPGLAWETLSLGYDHRNWGFGIQWGDASGETESDFFGDGSWSLDYLTLSVRYLFSPGSSVNPYLEIGGGAYAYTLYNDLAEIESEPAAGLRLAAGAKFDLGRFYLATEMSYHSAEFSDAEIDLGHRSSDLELDSRVDLLLFMVKTGIQARD